MLPVKALQLQPEANDDLLFATETTFWDWRFYDFLLFLTACKRPLPAWSDLYVRSMNCVTQSVRGPFNDNMQLHIS